MKTKLVLLFIPLLLPFLCYQVPVLSYITAWAGSVYLILASVKGWLHPLPEDLTLGEQVLKPIFIIQFIFCGYNFITSIFYFLNALGMRDFKWVYASADENELLGIANCQRYYLLAHVFFLFGLFSRGFENTITTTTNIKNMPLFLIKLSVITYGLYYFFHYLPGAEQFSTQFTTLNMLAVAAALAYSIIGKNNIYIVISAIMYVFNFYVASISAFKEPMIVNLLLVGIFLFPYYKKLIIASIVPFIFVAFVLIPSYVQSIRSQAGAAAANLVTEEIRNDAFKQAIKTERSNWEFLTERLSEISMFIKFTKSTPDIIPYYNFKILEQSGYALIPRVFWKEKPNTELEVMDRVIAVGTIVSESSVVSAKPTYVVDGYLSYGWIGISIAMFLYGFFLQSISLKAEKWFGGSFLGLIIFNGLFQIFWHSNSFEFILNSVLFAYLTLFIMKLIMLHIGLLEKVKE